MKKIMYYRLIFLLVLLSSVSANAQSVNLRGTVTNDDGDPLSGAVVTLLGMDLRDTTGDDGAYAIQTTPIMVPRSTAAGLVTLTGSLLEFNLSKPSPVTIEVFDIKNNLLKSEKRDVQEAGVYRWDVAKEYPANQLLIVRASVENEISTFRFMPLNGEYSGSRIDDNTSSKGSFLAKAAVAVDSLEIVASGYGRKVVEVETYDEIMDVILSIADRWGGLGNPPAPSAGCGSPQGTTTGKKTINSGGQNREYIIDIPSNYDQNTPYRLFFIFHWASGNADAMNRNDFYDLKNQANAAGEPSIFIAPSGIGGFWGQEDHGLFEDLLELAKTNLCIDTSRVFATGYSFGGMISYSLSTVHQDKLRAVVGMAPANWNIWIPEPKLPTPIPWLQIHGLQDETCLWVNSDSRREGGKYIVLEKAENNGCEIPGDDDFPVWQSGPHFCYEFEGCDVGYPVKICTNNGRHSGAERYTDPGENSSWVPPTAWEFYMRF